LKERFHKGCKRSTYSITLKPVLPIWR
jgi:hypothetical protein